MQVLFATLHLTDSCSSVFYVDESSFTVTILSTFSSTARGYVDIVFIVGAFSNISLFNF